MTFVPAPTAARNAERRSHRSGAVPDKPLSRDIHRLTSQAAAFVGTAVPHSGHRVGVARRSYPQTEQPSDRRDLRACQRVLAHCIGMPPNAMATMMSGTAPPVASK